MQRGRTVAFITEDGSIDWDGDGIPLNSGSDEAAFEDEDLLGHRSSQACTVPFFKIEKPSLFDLTLSDSDP